MYSEVTLTLTLTCLILVIQIKVCQRFVCIVFVDSPHSSELTFSPPKRVQNTHRAPHSPPECRVSSKCQWFRYNIKILHSDEV